MQGLNSIVDAPGMSVIGEDQTNIDIFTPNTGVQVDPASPSSPMQSNNVAKTMVVRESGQVQGQSPCGEEWPKSSIAKRVRMLPRPRNPSVIQSSLYLHPDRAVGKGKRKCRNVYTSRKQSKKHGGVSAA